jgi:hypothetical protein
MHALSLGTWWIHITSVLEWILAIAAVHTFGMRRREGGWRWLALAMLPALGSAMAACTWHLFDNPDQLRGLVVFQAGLTALGNACLALASWNLLRQQRRGDALLSSGLPPLAGLPALSGLPADLPARPDLAAGSDLIAPPAPKP